MAYVEMYIVSETKRNPEGKIAYEYSQELASAATGDWILIPSDVVTVAVTCEASGTTAKVQTTTDTVETVKSGTPTAVDWDDGSVSTATSAACTPPTAIRMIQAGAGSSKMTVRAQ